MTLCGHAEWGRSSRGGCLSVGPRGARSCGETWPNMNNVLVGCPSCPDTWGFLTQQCCDHGDDWSTLPHSLLWSRLVRNWDTLYLPRRIMRRTQRSVAIATALAAATAPLLA